MTSAPIDPNLAQALGELPPMFAPAPITWWPPAIGWFVLTGLLVAICVTAMVSIFRRIAETKVLNDALSAFSALREQTQSQLLQTDLDLNSQNNILERCSYIVRISAENYFINPRLSSLSGPGWLKKLDRLSLSKEPLLSSQSGQNILRVYENKLLTNEEILSVIDACSLWVSTTKDNHSLIKKADELIVESSDFESAIEREGLIIRERIG